MKEKIIDYLSTKKDQLVHENIDFLHELISGYIDFVELSQPSEKPSAEEWSIEEAERKFEYLLDQYETYVKYETTPIFLKDSVMEAFMNFWEQYAKQ
jgi:tryptophan synthase alpha subunit